MLGDLGDYGVAEGSDSVHPAGKPISHSIHSGFVGPPTISVSRGVWRLSSRRLRSAHGRSPPRSASDASGVGQDEQPLAHVWGAHRASAEYAGAGSVAKPSEVAENNVEASGPQTAHVLADDPCWSDGGDDFGHLGPEPSLVVLGELESGITDGLAGEAAGDHVNGRAGSIQPPGHCRSYVVVSWDIGPVPFQDAPAERVDLDLADDGHAGPLEAEVEATDASEERKDVHGATSSVSAVCSQPPSVSS